ncbi:hypothetical protein M2360_005307 [Rhizobium sp. SG_E_25_P2]|jgi:RTX calcium-binding nonapeptide repeat (4 copies)|uniref:hypothetical protein n=1 Tax=Rhizobium sp. SG_E_25_P2 TaxID=2879942 RepID=UPI002476F350|nr:hypothetical protein [Rhizobium sp. SG_E_25_P2]MDH6269875.1 hypothetical protein [Rhizobium sp. SG_E_25_P2]
MGKIKLYQGFFPSSNFLDKASFRLREHDADEMQFSDKRGAHVEIQGKDFAYSKGELVGGIITAMQIYDKEGDITLSARNISIKSDVFSFYYDRDGAGAFDYVHSLGKDTVIGSSGDDMVAGDDDDDVLFGKGGDDGLYAQFGTDTLHGGVGDDRFYFNYRIFDDAVIADFDDTGTVQDTMIVSYSMYKNMKIKQVGHDTVLHFDKHDVTLLDFKADDINKADFDFAQQYG